MITLRPVVWAASEGSRVHPLTTSEEQQKFTSFLDMDSAFQDTLERVSDPEFLPPLIVTTEELAIVVQDQCDEIAYDYEEMLILPEGHTSTHALKEAADWAQGRGESYPIVFGPSDHFIADQGAFLRAVIDAGQTAKKGYLVSFGVVADWAQAGQSYWEVGMRLDAGYSGHHVQSFLPHATDEQAKQAVKAGRFVWHAGMVCATPEVVLNECQDVKVSLEEGVLSQSDKLCVVSLLTAWADLTTWPGIWKALSLIET